MRAVTGSVDGKPFELASGEVLERRLQGSITLSVPRVLTLRLAAGVDEDPTSAQVQQDEAQLADLLAAAGAVDIANAGRLRAERTVAENTHAEQRRHLAEDLKELTPEAIESRLAGLRIQVDQFLAERGSRPPIAPDEIAGRSMVAAAELTLSTVERNVVVAEHEADSARAKLNELQLGAHDATVELRLAGEKVERLGAALNSSRSQVPDTELAARLEEAQTAAAATSETLHSAVTDLDVENAESIRQRFQIADEAVAATARELRAAEDDLLEVQTRLRDHGEDGLAEELDAAIAAVRAADRQGFCSRRFARSGTSPGGTTSRRCSSMSSSARGGERAAWPDNPPSVRHDCGTRRRRAIGPRRRARQL